MSRISPTLLILAAGLGSRYGSLKQIESVGPSGERIIDYSIVDAISAGFKKFVFVISRKNEKLFKKSISEKLPSDLNVEFVFQDLDSFKTDAEINPDRVKPWGTGHALLVASKIINEPFAVINADDYYGSQSYKIAYNFLSSNAGKEHNYALVGFKLKNTLSDFGNVSRGICEVDEDNFLMSIVERTEIKREMDRIIFKDETDNWKELNGDEITSMNMFIFRPTVFNKFKICFDSFLKESGTSLNDEFFLPAVVHEIIESKEGKVKILETPDFWFGLTYPKDKNIVSEKIIRMIEQKKYPKILWK